MYINKHNEFPQSRAFGFFFIASARFRKSTFRPLPASFVSCLLADLNTDGSVSLQLESHSIKSYLFRSMYAIDCALQNYVSD